MSDACVGVDGAFPVEQAPRFVALPAGVSLRHQASEENPAQPCSAIDVYFQVWSDWNVLIAREYR